MHSTGTGQVSESLLEGGKRGKKREKSQESAPSLEAPSSVASQSCRGPGVLIPAGKALEGTASRTVPKEPTSAIPCSNPQDTFGCPFCSWFHQIPDQGPSGTLSSLTSLPRSWSGKSQEMLTVVGSDRSQPWGHPWLCACVPANTHTHKGHSSNICPGRAEIDPWGSVQSQSSAFLDPSGCSALPHTRSLLSYPCPRRGRGTGAAMGMVTVEQGTARAFSSGSGTVPDPKSPSHEEQPHPAVP